jgi:hypothetical protein
MDAQHVQPEARSPKMAVIQMVLQAIQMWIGSLAVEGLSVIAADV